MLRHKKVPSRASQLNSALQHRAPFLFCASLHLQRRSCHGHSQAAARSSTVYRGGEKQDRADALRVLKKDATSSEAWREWRTTEQLQRIDVLTYLLGRYPRAAASADPAIENAANSLTSTGPSTGKTQQGTTPSAPASSASSSALKSRGKPKQSLHARTKQLDALTTRSLPTRSSGGQSRPSAALSSAASTPHAPTDRPQHTPEGPSSAAPSPQRLWASSVSTPSSLTRADRIGPVTPLAEIEQLAQQWLRRDRRVQTRKAEAAATDDAAWDALLTHPPELFSDDAAVYARFGMGGYVSPQAQGFHGLFRQQWQDFHVTEMVMAAPGATTTESAASGAMVCDAVPVSRDFNFSIPPLAGEALRHISAEQHAPAGSSEDEPDQSFFAVDVKQRIQELQAMDVRDADRAAVSFALSKEGHPELPHHTSRPATTMNSQDASAPPSAEGDLGGGEPRGHDSAETRFGQGREAKHQADLSSATASVDTPVEEHTGRHYLQCTLHKQHIAHGNALAAIAQTLRIHPRMISVAGIKDYIGDTVQRVRLENVSPASALAANRRFRQKRMKMTLSDFSYETAPLFPGDLFGNHFRVVLRDVDAPKAALAEAIDTFAEKGFPNYYGCQRFSWFAGRQDAAFALLRHNWLAFAFLFLNFTEKDRSLRELLQRPKKYPHPTQDEYRRNVVRRLRQIAVEPADLDVAPFLSCPKLNAPLTHTDGRPFSEVEEMICAQLREAYFDLNPQSRRLTAQRLSSYLWNQVLTLRLHHVGGERVLDGDIVAPAAIRQLSVDSDDRQDWYHTFGDCVSAANRHRYTIEDVVHPGFSFDAIRLPQNVVGAYYEQVCEKYALDWMAQHSRAGLRDFREPARPIIRRPLNLTHDYNADTRVLTLQFALERGCYANVALSELMKSVRCLGSEAVTVVPLPEALWLKLGEADPGYVTTLQDIYEGFEDGVGFVGDEAPVEQAAESTTKVWDHEGPLFLAPAEDPFHKAQKWSSTHLLRNSERKAREAEDMKRMLFDAPLARKLKEGEVDTYAGHIVPLPPNASAKEVYAKVMRRKRRYAGSPKMVTRMQRSTAAASHRSRSVGARKQPAFQSLNKNSWNFTW